MGRRATPYFLILPGFAMAAFIILWPLYQIGQISLHDVKPYLNDPALADLVIASDGVNSVASDKALHTVEVKVNRAGVRVRTIRGFIP